MRRAVYAFLLLTLLAPMTHAHGDHTSLHHLTVNVQDLAPGEFDTYDMVSEASKGDFREGWIITLYGGTQGPSTVDVNLTHEGILEENWTWQANQFYKASTRLSFGGDHELALTNTGTESVRYAFYYDQSCNCVGKSIPLPGGFVIFNYDLPADRDVEVAFPTVAGWRLIGKVALLENETGQWPQDFRVLTSVEQSGKGWLRLNFHTEEAERYYVFVEAPEGVTYVDGQPQPVPLTPQLTVEDASSSGLAATAAILVMGGLVVSRRRA